MNRMLAVFALILNILAGCSSAEHLQWSDTKEEAIRLGLQQESQDDDATLLSVEEYQG